MVTVRAIPGKIAPAHAAQHASQSDACISGLICNALSSAHQQQWLVLAQKPQLHGSYKTATWQLQDSYKTATWQLQDSYMAGKRAAPDSVAKSEGLYKTQVGVDAPA